MTTQTAIQAAPSQAPAFPAARPAPARGGFGATQRPRRRLASPKAAEMSPAERRAREEQNRKLIDEALAAGKVTKCRVAWADGAYGSMD